MCSKSGTTTQTQTIPPEVLARYKSINKYAEQVAKTPFQQYTGDFVANLTPTQLAGIKATNQYSQYAQPYYRNATQQLNQAQQQGMNRLNQSYNPLYEGMDAGEMMGNIARRQYMGAQGQAMPYYDAAAMGLGAALDFSQPYLGGATGAAYAGAEAITPEQLNIQGFMNPYTQAVAQTTQQALAQQQQEQAAGQIGNAIRSGGFGGDRAGLAAANLARQQQQGMAQAMAPIYQQGYSQALGSALSTAQANRAALQNLSSQLQGIGQQGYAQQMGGAQFAQQLGQGLYGMAMGTGQAMQGLGQQQFAQGLSSAQQLAALAQQGYGMGSATAQQLAALGAGGQQAALQGAQAQLGAGTLAQQTKQAELTANYQQFLQERGYPFQVAQFLANIAMGTGALSGSTTTTTQPMPFFSDRRVKEDVKEIGETHDGQPIYSFKYKGDDATRIGLMAQDVEKKHPDAVYDMGGVKGVDYKQATEDAERPERYAGGLVPASMGGAVTEPGAYNRGGYSPGGLVDPNDLQAILAQQQQAFGPFGEGGIYGASHHEAPFSSAKGIVPQARLHTPKLREMGPAPRLPDSGVQQAVSAFDTAMGMKDRYEKAKGLFGGDKTPQKQADEARPSLTTKEEVKNLSGPDIKAPSSGEDQGWIDWLREKTGLADGGVVPRHGYAAGSYVNPYDKAEEYFPEESLEKDKPELMKPGQAPTPTSQTGVGLGDLAKLAFLFLKDGGSVPRGHFAPGGSPVMDFDEETAPKIQTLIEEFPDIPLTSGYRSPEYNQSVRGVKNSQHIHRKAGDFSYAGVPEERQIAHATRAKELGFRGFGYYPGDDKKGPSVHFDTGSERAWGPNRSRTSLGQTPSWFQTLVGYQGGVVPASVTSSTGATKGLLPAPASDVRADFNVPGGSFASGSIANETGAESKGILPSIRSYLAENQDWLSPLGAGLKGMFQSRSPFLGAAIGEGIGAGLEAITPAQKAIADINLVKAQAIQTGSAVPEGSVFVGFDKDGSPMYRYKGELFVKRQKSPTQPTDTLANEQNKVIQKAQEAIIGQELPPPTEYGPARVFSNPNNPNEYSVDITPTEKSDRIFEGAIKPLMEVAGLEMSDLNPAIVNSIVQDNQNLKRIADADMEIAKQKQEAANANPQKIADLRMMSENINKLSQDAFTGSGADAEGRQALGYLANTIGKIVIGPEFQNQNWEQDIKSGAIIKKLREMMGTREAGASGIRAGYIAEALSSVSPGSSTPQEAANELLASMYIAALAERDFDKFFLKYSSKGTALGVNQAFRAETDDMYRSMKPLVKMALTPTMYDDGSGAKPTSPAQLLMEGKVTPREFDAKYGIPGFSRVFLGG